MEELTKSRVMVIVSSILTKTLTMMVLTMNEANPLVVPLLENLPSQDEITAQWFSQDVFMDAANDQGELNKDGSEDEMQKDALPKTRESFQELTTKKSKMDDDFEIVPAPATDSSDTSSSESSDEDDIGTKAEILVPKWTTSIG